MTGVRLGFYGCSGKLADKIITAHLALFLKITLFFFQNLLIVTSMAINEVALVPAW
jgi:hypothetical protein